MHTQIVQLLAHPHFVQDEHWFREQVAQNVNILKQGDTSRQIYIIEQGIVRVIGQIQIDQRVKINPGVCDLAEGQVFGELTLFDAEPRCASVKAVSDCELIVIDTDKLLVFMDHYPEVGVKLLKYFSQSMVDRLRCSNQKIYSLLGWGMKAHKIDQYLD